jgi:hypothetical protein
MHKFVEKVASFLGHNILFVYLISMTIGTAVFLTQQALHVSTDFLVIVGFTTALALELHSFLQQRLTRGLRQILMHLNEGTIEYKKALNEYKTHRAIMIGLITFSAFNCVRFWALETYPQNLWDWSQVVVLGLVFPVGFYLAGFLVPLNSDARAMVQDASAEMLHYSLKRSLSQFRRRMRKADKAGHNLTRVTAALLARDGDSDSADRIYTLDYHLTAAEQGVQELEAGIPAYLQAVRAPQSGPHVPYIPQYASPISGPTGAPAHSWMEQPTGPSQFGASAQPSTPMRAPTSGPFNSGTVVSGGRSVEATARFYYVPGMTASQLVAAAGISMGAARKYVTQFEAEAELASAVPTGSQLRDLVPSR